MSKNTLFSYEKSDEDEKENILGSFNDFAIKAAEYLKDKSGKLLKIVHLKGENQGYYWSPTSKKMILVPRKAEFYLLPYEKDENDRYYLFWPCFLTSGLVFCAKMEEIEFLGYN